MEQFLKALTKNKHLITMTVLCVLSVGIGGWYRDGILDCALTLPQLSVRDRPKRRGPLQEYYHKGKSLSR